MINLAPLNNHIYNQPFKMEGLENLRYLLNPGDYFVKIDLSDAYLSIPVHEDSQPYLAFIFDQVTYAFKTMPFGLNVAPARFTKVFKPVADLRAQSIRALIWLDNIQVISSSYSSCIRDRDIVMDLLVNLGFRLNMEKSVLIPTQSHLPRYGDRFINHDIFSSRRKGFSNCSKGNNSKEQESGIGKGNLPVYRNVLSYSPCSKGSSNPLSTASAPSDNLTEKKFTFKRSVLLSEIHASPPCPV